MKAEIDELLENEQTTVGQLFSMDKQEKQDEVMNQLRWGNKKVVQFFKRDRVSELIEFLTIVPPEGCSKDRGYKYPFYANQIFSEGGDGLPGIIEQFFYSEKCRKPAQNVVKQDSDYILGVIQNEPKDENIKEQTEVMKVDYTDNALDTAQIQDPDELEEDDNQQQPESITENIQYLVNMLEGDNNKTEQQKQPEEKPQAEEASPTDKMDDDNEFENELDQDREDFLQDGEGDRKVDELIAHFVTDDTKNVKKSFEIKYETDDDDDEIFIVHEEGENDDVMGDIDQQDSLFMQPPSMNMKDQDKKNDAEEDQAEEKATPELSGFEKIDMSGKDLDSNGHDKGGSPDKNIENPFKDNLANSEAIPTTQKLQVFINDNYLTEKSGVINNGNMKPQQPMSQSVVAAPTSERLDLQDAASSQMSSLHQENILKRKKNVRGKKQNLSMHQFDEAIQKSIQETVEKERQNIIDEENQQQTAQQPIFNTLGVVNSEPLEEESQRLAKSGATDGTTNTLVVVEDHFIKRGDQKPIDDKEKKENEDDDLADDNINDREQPEEADENKEEKQALYVLTKFDQKKEIGVAQNSEPKEENKAEDEEDEDLDNILRKSAGPQKSQITLKANLKTSQEKSPNPGSPESPTSSPESPESPFDTLTTPKYLDQVSIEIPQESEGKLEKIQDYALMDRFFSFLDQDQEGTGLLNSTLCGYFCKVLQVMINHEPKEMYKYCVSNDFIVLDKMAGRLDDKSICEIFIKMFDEILNQSNVGNAPGVSEAATHPENENLQQSGQSGEAQNMNKSQNQSSKTEYVKNKLRDIVLQILEKNFGQNSTLFDKLGASEVLRELLKNKECYQTLTTKKAFEIMTQHLVDDSEDTKKFTYMLLENLIQLYEKHERFEKRINIDNFEDEDLMNSHSGSGFGSFNEGKRSRNSKKQNQDVLKDIQESDLFQFSKVVIQEISAQEIEKKFDDIQGDRDGLAPVRLTRYFIALMEFIERASTTFTGFSYDINQMIIDKDIFNYMFDILEYYKHSDIFLQKVFKILENIIKSKNDDIQEMLRYLLEETKLIKFLIQNGPELINKKEEKEEEQLTDSQTEKNDPGTPESKNNQLKSLTTLADNKEGSSNSEKSPEQSTQKKDDSLIKSTEQLDPKKIVVSCFGSAGLQAYVKKLSVLLIDYQKRDKTTQENMGKADISQQSGSSEIIIETEEEQQVQRVCQVVVHNLNDNQEWISYVKNTIGPISELEKGKLCQDEQKDGGSQSDNNSDNNIFDDDFMRSDFAMEGNDSEGRNSLDLQADSEKAKEGDKNLDEDENDHQKFFKKMQECFSSNTSKRKRRNSDHIDIDEREMKQGACKAQSEVNDDLRAHLSDMASYDEPDINDYVPQKRDRSTSNENFNLPPLPSDEENRDFQNLDNPDFDNYKSNEKPSSPNPISSEDEDDESSAIAQKSIKQSIDIDMANLGAPDFGTDLELDDVDIDLGCDPQPSGKENYSEADKIESRMKDFDLFSGLLPDIKSIPNEDDIQSPDEANNSNEKIDFESIKANESQQAQQNGINNTEIEEIKSIFDKIAQLDSFFDSEDDNEKEDNIISAQENQQSELLIPDDNKEEGKQEVLRNTFGNKSEVFTTSKHSIGIQQSIDEICNDFPGVVIQNRFEDPMEGTESSTKILAKSEYIQSKSLIEPVEERPEYHDNEFWSLKKSQMECYDIDELIKDYQ